MRASKASHSLWWTTRACNRGKQRLTCTRALSSPHHGEGPQELSRTFRAAAFTGAYAVAGGITLVAAPQACFGLLFPTANVSSGWIRVGGILFSLIGMQYGGAAVDDMAGKPPYGFYKATIISRVLLAAGFAILVATQQCPLGLLLLAAINLVGAYAMHRACSSSLNKLERNMSQS